MTIARIFATLTLSAVAPLSRGTTPKPNVVFVIADEWRYQAMGYAGDHNARTPVLDGFAHSSVNFENAVAGCPVCSPSRASLMTGQYPLTNGVYINDVPLMPKGPTLAESFAAAGYHTAYIGKWHLFGSPEGHWERRFSYIPPGNRLGFQSWKASECTHDYSNSVYYEDDDPTPKIWPGYDASAQTTDACRLIQQQARNRSPFFLVLSLAPPHFPIPATPTSAPARFAALYQNRTIELRPNVPADKRYLAQIELRDYYANIAALDECFGQLLAAIDQAGLAQDTIVVFCSDHGDMMYSQGLLRKLFPWDESVRVPFLIRYPRKFGSSGHTAKALINYPDIMPTLLGMSGISIPSGVQGVDYSDDIDGHKGPASAFLGVPVPFIEMRTTGISEYRGVRTSRYTYIRSHQGPWLLYDNLSDPYQMHNLCGSAEVKGIQAVLEAELKKWLLQLGDKFLPAEDYLRRDNLTAYLEPKLPIGHIKSPWSDWESTLPPEHAAALSLDSPVSDFFSDPPAKARLEHAVPSLRSNPGWEPNSRSTPAILINQALLQQIEARTMLEAAGAALTK